MSNAFHTAAEHEVHNNDVLFVQTNDVLLHPTRDMNLKLDSVDLSSIVEIEEDGDEGDAFSSLLWRYCNNTARIQSPPQSNHAGMNKSKLHDEITMTMLAPVIQSPPVEDTPHQEAMPHLSPLPLHNDDFVSQQGKMAIDNALHDIMPDPLPTVQFASTRHPGNNRFYLLLQMYRDAFLKAASDVDSAAACDQIALKIMDIIYTKCVPTGRFLEVNLRNSNKTSYKILNPNKEVLDIVKWALRQPPQAELARYFKKDNSFVALNKNNNMTSVSASSDIFTSARRRINPTSNPANNTTSPLAFRNSPSNTAVGGSSRTTFSDSYVSSESSARSNYSFADSLELSNFKWDSRSKKNRRRRKRSGVIFGKDVNNGSIMDSLKRRGTISSVVKEKGQKNKKINLSDRRFSIDTPLSRLVEEVVAPRKSRGKDTTDSTCNTDTSGSKSTVNRLGSQIGNFNIESDSEETQTSKTSLLEMEENLPTIVKTSCGGGDIRPVSQYDILCGPSLTLHNKKTTGTFRLRTMLQMNKGKFHTATTTEEEKKSIVEQIIKNITECEGKEGLFVQEKNGLWLGLENDIVQKLVENFMQECPVDQSLQLPSLKEALAKSSLISSPVGSKEATFTKLHSDALSSIKNKRRKKKTRDFDPSYVSCLQSVMLEKRQKKLSHDGKLHFV